MEDIVRRHFFQHGPSKRSESCHFCQIRSFATHTRLPITIVNEVDKESVIPANFKFIDSSVFGRGVEPTADNFRSGCECPAGQDCMYDGCHCLGEMDSDDEADGSDDGRPRSGLANGARDGRTNKKNNKKKKFQYHNRGSKAGLLRSKFLNSRQPIYECHDGCACGKECPNRVVERGRQVPFQIFRTTNRGWGVKTMASIRRGQFVDKYLGEIITSDEAEQRREASGIAQRKDVYLFALDKFSDKESPDPRLRGEALEVDGEFMSGPSRFINHSCEPNLRIFARVGDHTDKHIHDLAFFAIRDIAKGEELTFDYVDGLVDMDTDARDPTKQGDMTPCLCGTKRCRGFLW